MVVHLPKMCFQGRLGNVLRMSRERAKSTSHERPLKLGLGHPKDVI